jgi:hypothetical protein
MKLTLGYLTAAGRDKEGRIELHVEGCSKAVGGS